MKVALKQRLGDLLVEERVISNGQLQLALERQREQGGKLGKALVALGFISESQLLSFLAHQLGIPVLDISRLQITASTVNLLPEVHARRYRALVVEADDHSVTVAMSDPADLSAQDTLETLLSPRRLELAAATDSQLMDAFDNLYRETGRIASLAGELEQEYGDTQEFSLSSVLGDTADSDAAVVRLLQSIFDDAVQVRASDIHIEPDEKLLRIRYRVDGQLMEHTLDEFRISNALVLRIKLMAELDISEKRLPQDGRFQIQARGHDFDVRVSTMPTQYGETVVMRLLDHAAGLLELEQTGMPAALIARLRAQIRRPHGMILITGPTGSGKTTSLYGVLNELNQPHNKIITVEDPVEYRLERISQVQVNSKIELDFARILRTALRQDPDIIMVGEMRDQETVEIGLRGALTGHLVLSTLHTNDAISSTLRLIDMGAAPYLVASALRAIVAQRLVRRICQHCEEPHPLSAAEKAWLRHVGGEALADGAYRRGTGCQRCNQSGYRGRIGVYELLEFDDDLVEALLTEDPRHFAKTVKARPRFRPLALAALDYALEGITTLAEAMRLAEDLGDNDQALSQQAEEH
ncbi:GspE/PulE family protein [Ferrimonas pelagia]|uniref:GspE/PulE family protein n=1 Tax=Ferrimonas pelagia TaxID=1177826 RepID=A0ABP9FGT8_9GAMM